LVPGFACANADICQRDNASPAAAAAQTLLVGSIVAAPIVGAAALDSLPLLADALGPSGNIFGRERLGGSSLFNINANPFLRIGWGWSGTATEGTNVFRVSGSLIERFVENGHIDLFTRPYR
jgi:hypothetical protein